MDNDLKSGLGYIIPIGAISGYVLALVAENFYLAMILSVAGILLWFIYLLIMEIRPPQPFGNFIVLFGVLLAFSVFLSTGLEQDIFGGYMLKSEGLIYAVLILFFTIMAGVLFRTISRKQDMSIESQLSQADRELVEKAISRENGVAADPRIIVVKQEAPAKEDEEAEGEEEYEYEYDPYAYTYPPEYYDEEDEDEEYEDDEEEYEDEEEEYEDEEEED